MELKYLFKEDMKKKLDFNEETGKYEKEIGDYRIEINSWNAKIFVKKEGKSSSYLPSELIKLLIDINDKFTIKFEESE